MFFSLTLRRGATTLEIILFLLSLILFGAWLIASPHLTGFLGILRTITVVMWTVSNDLYHFFAHIS
jgi:hypothetical protein